MIPSSKNKFALYDALCPGKVDLIGGESSPVRPLAALNRELPVPVSVKFESALGRLGPELSGNKLRKLEFLLREARARGAEVVVTCGSTQSNHCRATAAAARAVGLDAHLLLRGEPPAAGTVVTAANELLMLALGASTSYCSAADYADRRDELMAEWAAQCGRPAFVIGEGGSTGLGAWGYVSCLRELLLDGRAGGASGSKAKCPWTHLAVAVGSGGTLAGLIIGRQMFGLADLKLLGFIVCDTVAYFERELQRIVADFNQQFGTNFEARNGRDYHLVDQYVGAGYGVPFREQAALMARVAALDGLVLDPTYTGKAFYGLLDLINRGQFGISHAANSKPLFLHTGGALGLLSHPELWCAGAANDALRLVPNPSLQPLEPHVRPAISLDTTVDTISSSGGGTRSSKKTRRRRSSSRK